MNSNNNNTNRNDVDAIVNMIIEKRKQEKTQAAQQKVDLRKQHDELRLTVSIEEMNRDKLAKELQEQRNVLQALQIQQAQEDAAGLSDNNLGDIGELSAVNGQWKITNKLGEGSTGYVFEAFDIYSGETVAVKLVKSENSSLDLENCIYQELEASARARKLTRYDPKVHYFGRYGDFNAMVVDRLGPSLDELQSNFIGGVMPVESVMSIGIDIIDRIEALHNSNIVHCDVKPSNVLSGMKGLSTWHLIDFDLCCAYRNPDTNEILPVLSGCGFRGSPIYGSVAAHKGESLSGVSDLESLGYVLLNMIKGGLPWAGANVKNAEENHMCKKMKREVLLGSCPFLIGIPSELSQYFSYVRDTEPTETPNYDRLRGYLRRAAFRFAFDGMFATTFDSLPNVDTNMDLND